MWKQLHDSSGGTADKSLVCHNIAVCCSKTNCAVISLTGSRAFYYIFVSQAQITNIPSTVTKVWNRGIGYIQDVLKRDEDR